jgi:hypothetical protein
MKFYAPFVSENPMEPNTPEAFATTSQTESPMTITPPVPQPRKPFGAGSYLENLAKTTVEEEPSPVAA